MDLKITPSGQTIVKPTALGPVANTDTKLLIYGLFQKDRVLAQDGVVVRLELDSRSIAIDVVDGISVVLDSENPPEILCIDVPIGLLDEAVRGGRECDKAARKLLGSPRSSSVFSAPARPALKGRSFEEALRLNRESSAHAVGISQQCFGIIPKIREVDDYMTPELQGRVVEVHPELVFYEMSGGKSVKEGKKSKGGLAHRLELLAEAFDFNASELVENHRSSKVARDDIVDAMAACWTAERILKGEEVRVPNEPVRDSKGLLMEIVR